MGIAFATGAGTIVVCYFTIYGAIFEIVKCASIFVVGLYDQLFSWFSLRTGWVGKDGANISTTG